MELSKEKKCFRSWMLTIIGISLSAIIFMEYFDLFVISLLAYGLFCIAIYILKEETTENSTKNFILKWIAIALSPSILCLIVAGNYELTKVFYQIENSIIDSKCNCFSIIIDITSEFGAFMAVGIVLLIITVVICILKKAFAKAIMAIISSLLAIMIVSSVDIYFTSSDLRNLGFICISVLVILVIAALFKKHHKQALVTILTLPIILSAMLEITALVLISLRNYEYYWIDYVISDISRLFG